MLLLIISIFVFFSAGVLGSQLVGLLTEKYHRFQRIKLTKAERQLGEMFIVVPLNRLLIIYTLSPLILGIIGFLIFNKLIAFLIGLAVGSIIPELIIKNIEAQRRRKFQTQLIDALMTLSSALKGGLSLMQAMEVVVEELPPPLSQEFSLVVRENKVGVPFEESLTKLNNRVRMEELELFISSILVARETGGDLTKVLTRLANSLRDKNKLKEHIKTLTLQGKIQGTIMSLLPIFFVGWVVSFNRSHFDIMLETDLGRMLLFIAAILQVTGIILIIKFSKLNF